MRACSWLSGDGERTGKLDSHWHTSGSSSCACDMVIRASAPKRSSSATDSRRRTIFSCADAIVFSQSDDHGSQVGPSCRLEQPFSFRDGHNVTGAWEFESPILHL